MDLQLKPTADACRVTSASFQEGDRVVSFLVREVATGELLRYDCLATAEAGAAPGGEVLCQWTRTFKPATVEVNHDRALKLTADSLLLALTEDPDAPLNENGPLKQFLALMLERKRLVRARGRTAEGDGLLYEHQRTKRMLSVPAGEMDAAFFAGMRDKLGALLGDAPSAPTDAAQQQQQQ